MPSAVEQIARIEALHARYAGVLYDRCLRILGDRTDAEDAVQETFLQAFRALPNYVEQERGPLPWLYTIATSMCLRALRTRRRRGAHCTIPLVEAGQPPSASDDPLSALVSRQALAQLLHGLDQRSLAILISHYVDGRSQGQIAGQLGISRRAVVKRLTRLRQAARGQLEAEGGSQIAASRD